MSSGQGQVVIVAGVGSGLGSAVVSLLGAAGANPVGIARSPAALERLTAHAQRRSFPFLGLHADLTVQAEVDRAVGEVVQRFGRIDGLSLNVGHWVEGDTLLHKSTEEAWTQGLVDNLHAVYRVGRAVLPRMIERKSGSLVLVSAAERVRYAGSPSYCAAKGAIADLTRKLARDYRPFGVRVNAVLPGTMEHDVDLEHPPDPAEPLALRDASGVGSWEVARAICHLLSDESRWVTGASLTVDGGYSTRGKEPPAA